MAFHPMREDGEYDINELPAWPKVAFEARCARRALSVFLHSDLSSDRNDADRLLSGIIMTEAAAEQAGGADAAQASRLGQQQFKLPYYWHLRGDAKMAAICASDAVRRALDAAFKVAFEGPQFAGDLSSKVDSAATSTVDVARYLARSAEFEAENLVLDGASGHALHGALNAAENARTAVTRIETAVEEDLAQLLVTAREQAWTHSTSVSRLFFPTRISMGLGDNERRRGLYEILPTFTDELVSRLREQPNDLYALSPRAFEELIAQIFDRFGYAVELTQRTRDGGCDIVAVRDGRNSARYLIECKRYAKENRVGVGIVRQLGGVVTIEGATKGIVVTTSTFTDPARETLRRASWMLEGQDFDSVCSWLRQYDQLKLAYSFLRDRLVRTPAGLLVPQACMENRR
jgi:restriction endonuclease Mrr